MQVTLNVPDCQDASRLVYGVGICHGEVQAVHSHPVSSQASHHSCSICSAPTLGPAVAAIEMLSMGKPVRDGSLCPASLRGIPDYLD